MDIQNIEGRVQGLDWAEIEQKLDDYGYATTSPILTPEECTDLVNMYPLDARFRSRIVMEKQGFGLGEYKYFSAPLPPIIQALRQSAYPFLVPIANRWMRDLELSVSFEESFADFIDRCARRGQTKPTPLILRYEVDGFNNLHQDVYGPLIFPFQMTFVLSRLGKDYSGGEFLLVEQQARSQWRGTSITLDQGSAVIFPVRDRPAIGNRKTNIRHGTSRLLSGMRFSLGIIFHNAE